MESEDSSSSGTFKIRCSNIPDELIKKRVARQHFEQFGEVLHMIIKPKSKLCYVHYKYYKNAQSALLNGSHYNGKKFNISIFNNISKKKMTKKESDPLWMSNVDVQSELDAMHATGENRRNYNLRQEAMSIDIPNKQPQLKPRTVIKRNWTGGKDKDKREWTAEQLELLSILKQSVYTIEDKYKVLEARDKLMRLRGLKHTDLTKVTATVGTCPDMCPEKERLLREIQHQVALYEQDTNGRSMNPSLAIKQYSRSSADQEAPLAHELRPVSVLQLSMSYLTHCIMDLCDSEEVNLAEWFHFLWDRTRSIRKDITQQELCCQGSVALIEQCARFHIHCSARLVAEDPSVFDQKINTENLTKCLQTLKYMYHDLNLKGESCINEPEFRAYIILLNLNDGNFMWEVQQLKIEIQKSLEVKFALDIYSAIDKNNFVKFFKLVRSANYLNACILLRYFIQVRSRALSTILKCYSPRMPYTQFSLIELQQLLAFEDISSTIDFITSFGLHLSQDQTQVVLDRKIYQQPEIPLVLDRAIRVVESKRLKKIGEVVCGGTLPPPYFKNYVPHNSFNNSGILIVSDSLSDIIKDAQSVSKQEVIASIEEKGEDEIDFVKPDLSQSFWSSEKDPNRIFKTKSDSPPRFGIFGAAKSKPIETTKPFAFKQRGGSIFGEQSNISFLRDSKQSNNQTENILQNKVDDTTNVFTNKRTNLFSVPQFSQEPKVDEPTMKNFFVDYKSNAETLTLNSDQKSTSFGDPKPVSVFGSNTFCKTIPEAIKPFNFESNIAGIEKSVDCTKAEDAKIKLEEERKRRHILEEEEKKRQQKVMMEQKRLDELKRKELEEKLRNEEETRKLEQREVEKNKKIAIMIEKQRLLELEIKKSVTDLMNSLLVEVEARHEKEVLEEIALKMKNFKIRLFIEKWQQKCRVNKRKRHSIENNPVWLPNRTVNEEARELFSNNQIVTLHNIKRYKSGKSLAIAVPARKPAAKFNAEQYYALIIQRFSRMRIRIPKDFFWKIAVSLPNFQEMKTNLSVIEEFMTNYFNWKDRYGTTATINQYRSDKLFNYYIERKQGVLSVDNNTNALLFVASEPNDVLYKRISASLNNFSSHYGVALAVLLINPDPSKINAQNLGRILDKAENVLNYKVSVTKSTDFNLSCTLSETLAFLAKNIQKPVPLQLDSLNSFINSHLITSMWKKLASYAAWNSQFKKCLQIPNLVINLYNEGLDRLKEVTFDESSMGYPDFPVEFEPFLLEKSPEMFPCNYKYFPSFWRTESYRNLISNTVSSLRLPQYRGMWPPTSESNLEKSIFEYCSKISANPQSLFYKVMVVILKKFDPSEDFEKIKNTLWIDILEVIAVEKLSSTNFSLHLTEFFSKSAFTQLFVIYNINTLDNFKSNEWFYLEHPLIKIEIRRMNEKLRLQEKIAQAKNVEILEEIDLDAMEKTVRGLQMKKCHKNTEIEQLEGFIADLEQSMEIHKRINAIFQNTVQKALSVEK